MQKDSEFTRHITQLNTKGSSILYVSYKKNLLGEINSRRQKAFKRPLVYFYSSYLTS